MNPRKETKSDDRNQKRNWQFPATWEKMTTGEADKISCYVEDDNGRRQSRQSFCQDFLMSASSAAFRLWTLDYRGCTISREISEVTQLLGDHDILFYLSTNQHAKKTYKKVLGRVYANVR